jgi:CheY-like chemotaxis protein
VPVTILVADDSATMRSILEMTFAGEDARVVTVDGGAAALERALDLRPDIVIADLSMEMDGYEVSRAIKSGLPGTAVVVLASQHTPYDEAKGREASVDDHIVKPFDTQNVIDRIHRLAAAPRAAAAPAAPPAHPYRESQQAAPRMQTAPFAAPAVPAAPPRPAVPAAAPPPAAPPGTVAAPRPGMPRTTVAFGSAPAMPAAPPAAPAAAPRPAVAAPVAAPRPPAMAVPVPAAQPAPAPQFAAAAPAAARPAAVVDAATTAISAKLGGLGLTAQQADAVLALSREVIERVVWEVVPDLAETIIREELKRLTAES